MPEQYPASYLNTFAPFVDDDRSERYASALLYHHIDKGPPRGQDRCQLLDVCCGTGHMGRVMAKHISNRYRLVETTFLDQSKVILDEINLIQTDHVICTDVSSMPEVTSASFDFAVCRYGFNNLPQEKWLPALNEVLRVLKPGGIFLLQDHFVPGATFSALINEAERFLAKLEGKDVVPFIFSTDVFNIILDEHPLIVSRIKTGHELVINIWDRICAKREILPDFETARQQILGFYRDVVLKKFQVLVVDDQNYIPVNLITYAIEKRR